MFPTSLLFTRLIICSLSVSIFVPASCACSTNSFPSIYKPYPDCAAQCLACPDNDYVNNFAHNCNYTNGDCCRSRYHTVIAATWECVQTSCNGLAQQAFDTFVQYCKDVNVPLASVDVPQGYELTDAAGGSENGNGTTSGSSRTSSNGSSSLSGGTIAGIVAGSVTAVAAILGAIYRYLSWRHKKNNPTRTPQPNNQVVPYRPAWEVLPHGAFQGDADGRAVYTRKEFTWTLGSGIHRTNERMEIRRQPTPPAAAVLGRGRILGRCDTLDGQGHIMLEDFNDE